MAGLFLTACTAGCLSPQQSATAERIQRGKVLMLPGAVGITWQWAGFETMVREVLRFVVERAGGEERVEGLRGER